MPTYQTIAITATSHVLTSGVRWRGWMCPTRAGIAPRRAIERPVREAGMIVVWVEAMAAVETESSRIQPHPPSTSVASVKKTDLLLAGVVAEPLRAGEGDHGDRHGDVGQRAG